MTTNALAATSNDARRLTAAAELAGFVVQAKTMDDAMKVCDWLSKSSLIPKAYQGNPQAIWTAGAMGQKLGVDLFTSLTGIASINGRPCVWGDLLRGLILAHPLLVALEETMEGSGNTLTAVCTITRRGLDPYTARFGIADAQAAGLLNKDGPWKQYPADMLVNRAFGRAARRRFADVLSGLHVAEEMEDAREVEAVVTDSAPEPRAAKERALPATPTPAPAAEQTTIADATGPKPPTQKDVNEAAIKLHADFKGAATAALKAINADLGISKISECPAEKVAQCIAMLTTARATLQAAADAAAKPSAP